MSDLILHEIGHLAMFSIFASLIYFLAQKYYSFFALVIGYISTIFIDLDHLFDYFLHKGFGFSLKEFIDGGYFHANGMVIVFLHSWELATVLFVLSISTKKLNQKRFLLFLSAGIFAHLVFDTIYYGFDWQAYLLLNRIAHGFSEALF